MAGSEVSKFCELSEYEQNRAFRIQDPLQLSPGSIYIGMLCLESEKHQAAMMPIRLLQKTAEMSGQMILDMAFLDTKFDEVAKIKATGIFTSVGYIEYFMGVTIYNPDAKLKERFSIGEGYLRHCFEGLDDFMLGVSRNREIKE